MRKNMSENMRKNHILSSQQVNFSLVNQTRSDKDSWEQPRTESSSNSRTFLAQFGLVYRCDPFGQMSFHSTNSSLKSIYSKIR